MPPVPVRDRDRKAAARGARRGTDRPRMIRCGPPLFLATVNPPPCRCFPPATTNPSTRDSFGR
jgi:hypothetical protein